MHFPVFMLIPLSCALIYVVGMLMLKRASEVGVGIWRATFFANWACADISSLVDFAWLGSRGVVALLAAGAEWAAFLRGAGRDVFGNYPR